MAWPARVNRSFEHYLDPLGVVDEGGEDDDAEHQKEDEQHQLLPQTITEGKKTSPMLWV